MTASIQHPERGHRLPGNVLASARANAAIRREADIAELLLACEWADSHPVLADAPHSAVTRSARRRREAQLTDERRRIAADWLAARDPDSDFAPGWAPEDRGTDPWLPEYAWDCAASFAAAIGVSTTAGSQLIDDALILRHRMPNLWARTLAGEVAVWRTRRIAARAWREPEDVVEALDLEVTPHAHSIGATGLDRLVDEIMARLLAEIR